MGIIMKNSMFLQERTLDVRVSVLRKLATGSIESFVQL